MAISVSSGDGAPHAVQLYVDFTAELLSQDRALAANWSVTADTGSVVLQTQLQAQAPFAEDAQTLRCTQSVSSMRFLSLTGCRRHGILRLYADL